jgi:glycosyltransferase involved in cell wall biosynthesis
MKNVQLSIVVCTFNRSFYLQRCLDSLVAQKVNRNFFEILIIDNNSSDDTKSIVGRYAKKYLNIKYFFEKKQGLSYARNRGWREVGGTYVAYIDDDAIASKNWIKEILIFLKKHPDIEVFGGPYFSFFDKKLPEWYPLEFTRNYLGNKVKRISFGAEWLSGTNMVYKKITLARFGGFDVHCGMKGTSKSYGEEFELQSRINSGGALIYYSPKIWVKHHLSNEKISLRWLLYRSYISGKESGILNGEKNDIIGSLKAFFKSCIYGIYVFMFNTNNLPLKRRLFYLLYEPVSRFGMLSSVRLIDI